MTPRPTSPALTATTPPLVGHPTTPHLYPSPRYVGIDCIKKSSLVFLFFVLLSVMSIWLGVMTHSASNEGKGGSSDQWADSHGLVGMTAANFQNNLGAGYTKDK